MSQSGTCIHGFDLRMSCSSCMEIWLHPAKERLAPHDYESWTMQCRGCGWTKAQIESWCRTSVAWDECRGNKGPVRSPDTLVRKATVEASTRRTRVYVSGPLTTGMLTANVRRAADAANELLEAGFAVYLPHTNVLWEMIAPPCSDNDAAYEKWLGHDFEWVEACDVILRLDGASHGADREVALAATKGMPVYKTVRDIVINENTRVPR